MTGDLNDLILAAIRELRGLESQFRFDAADGSNAHRAIEHVLGPVGRDTRVQRDIEGLAFLEVVLPG